MTPPPCRFCSAPLTAVFADLGVQPVANDIVRPERLDAMEPFYPLKALVCDACRLVQLGPFETIQALFRDDYTYFSSVSKSWLDHASRYQQHVTQRFGLGPDSKVVEVASNDGYLLQYFAQAGIPVLGVEPTQGTADVAIEKGIPTVVEFFGVETAASLVGEHAADLIAGNNVLAHVPDLNDFVGGLKTLLKPTGAITIEFPHLQRQVEGVQFDTIYHEHYSYFSILAVTTIFAEHGLTLFDVEELPTHGGSVRIYAQHEGGPHADTGAPAAMLERERSLGYDGPEVYAAFETAVRQTKRDVLAFFLKAKDEGKTVVGYGAPAKGNTLLNYCGIGTDLLDFTVDLSPVKQGGYLPGTRIPILAPEAIDEAKPDYVFILPWNLRDEIVEQMAHIRDWGGQFVVRTPTFEVL